MEELVGITRKNIRFYEDQGLLNVERAENGYREYHQEDVIRLQEIKLFRKMDISIEEMKLLSIEYIPGVDFEPLGIVKGTVVPTKNVGRDFMSGAAEVIAYGTAVKYK